MSVHNDRHLLLDILLVAILLLAIAIICSCKCCDDVAAEEQQLIRELVEERGSGK